MAARRTSSRWFVRVDVDHATNPKMLGIEPLARLLYIDALCYSAHWQTDGLVDARWIGSQEDGKNHANNLAVRGLFERDGDDYRIHDYCKHQISKDGIDALSRAGRAAVNARWAREENPTDKGLDTDRIRPVYGSYPYARPLVSTRARVKEEKTLKPKTLKSKSKSSALSDLPGKSSPPAPKEVLDGWNQIFGKSYTVQAWGGKLTACIRAHPEVTLAEHLEMIKREHAAPWWKHDRPETPALQYGTVAQFERCIQRDTAPRLSPGDRVVQQLRAQRAQSEGNGHGNV